VQILNPYNHDERFTLEAELTIRGSELEFDYVLSDPEQLFELPVESKLWHADLVPRAMALWDNTCFEAFLQPQGLEMYYEFNFSFRPAWNGFQFESYRQPQPLVETADFKLESLEWIAPQKRLIVRLKNLSGYHKFRVGLTTVLKEKNNQIHYCSISHKGLKPDFHLADNFTLDRKA